MNIDWDAFPADQLNESAAPPSREPLSEGIHKGVIDRVVVEGGWRVSPDNPSGDCLSIWIDCDEGGERKRVFVTVPVTQLNRISVIARACGVAPPERGRSDWDEGTLVGRECTVETSQYIVQNGPRAGETRASVRRWIVPEAAKPAAPAPAAKQAAKPPAMKVNKAAKAAMGAPMTSHFKPLPPATFLGGPACGADFDGYGIDKFPKHIRVPHRGRLYAYTLHFKRRNGLTVYAYRFSGVVIDVTTMERNEIE